jgi:hypothetical protein
MPLTYTGNFSAVAVTAQQDLFEIVAPSTAIVVVKHILITQNTEFGDAQEEELRLLIKRGQTTTGSGGTTVTPVPLETRFPSSGSTVKANNTTKATAGTIVTLHVENWNVRMPYILLPTPENVIILGPSVRMTLELATTPADSITMDGTVYFTEIG